MSCGCWKLPEDYEFAKNVKLDNRKFCFLYPKKTEYKLVTDLEPNFEHCKTLYTKCDFKLEACVHEQILKIEDQLRAHEILVNKEFEHQRDVVDKMWVLSQRYLILTGGGVCIKPYPEWISKQTEREALHDFYEFLSKVHESNARMTSSIQNIKKSLEHLYVRITKLDMTVESPFLQGNHRIKPLAEIVDMLEDLYKYFYCVSTKLNAWVLLIDPGDSRAIDDYKALLEPREDFKKYMLMGMENCKCFRIQKGFQIASNETCL